MSGPFSQYSEEEASRISTLIAGYVTGKLTQAEHVELDDWINKDDRNLELFERLTDPEHISEGLAYMRGIDTDAALQKTKARMRQQGGEEIISNSKPAPSLRRMLPYAAAAVVIVVLGFFGWRYYQDRTNDGPLLADLLPGKEKAILKTGDGNSIALDQTVAGTKIGEGMYAEKEIEELVYDSVQRAAASEHELKVPKAGMYRVQLMDGTKVWLNAESVLRYPVPFDGNERRVQLRGEGYFEVARNEAKPFIVENGAYSIQVLGTKFNVNGYGDVFQNVTSVKEGRVALRDGKAELILGANQQGTIMGNGMLVKGDLQSNYSFGWTQGKIIFENAPIDQVMNEIARWYDAEIIYKTKPKDHFNLELDRKESLRNVLRLMEITERVRFEIEGRKVIVREG